MVYAEVKDLPSRGKESFLAWPARGKRIQESGCSRPPVPPGESHFEASWCKEQLEWAEEIPKEATRIIQSNFNWSVWEKQLKSKHISGIANHLLLAGLLCHCHLSKRQITVATEVQLHQLIHCHRAIGAWLEGNLPTSNWIHTSHCRQTSYMLPLGSGIPSAPFAYLSQVAEVPGRG